MKTKYYFLLLLLFSGCISESKNINSAYSSFDDDVILSLEYCDSLGGIDNIEFCKVNLAQDLKQLSICDLIVDRPYEVRCIWGVAKSLGDESICKSFDIDAERVFCTAVVTKDRDLCLTLPTESERIGCIKFSH